jgi:site-specific recombinase XerD
MNIEAAEEKLRSVIRRRHLAYATEDTYAMWLRRFARFVCERSPEGAPALKMERFLTQLARQEVSASTQNQAFNAVLFFYREVLGIDVGKVDSLRAKGPQYIRTAPSVDEVRALLAGVKDTGGYPTRLIVRMIYGMGLRVSEPLNLRIKDVCLPESKVILRRVGRIARWRCRVSCSRRSNRRWVTRVGCGSGMWRHDCR